VCGKQHYGTRLKDGQKSNPKKIKVDARFNCIHYIIMNSPGFKATSAKADNKTDWQSILYIYTPLLRTIIFIVKWINKCSLVQFHSPQAFFIPGSCKCEATIDHFWTKCDFKQMPQHFL
jgi:hypothetical protein